jgi:hypothetical protein
MGELRLPWEERRERRRRAVEGWLLLVLLGGVIGWGLSTCVGPVRADAGGERDAAARMERLVRAEEAQSAALKDVVDALRRGCR